MFATDSHRPTCRELAHRLDDSLEVSLVWDELADTVALHVHDHVLDDRVELEVPRDRALHAFQHPDAYVTAMQAVKRKSRGGRRRFPLLPRR